MCSSDVRILVPDAWCLCESCFLCDVDNEKEVNRVTRIHEYTTLHPFSDLSDQFYMFPPSCTA